MTFYDHTCTITHRITRQEIAFDLGATVITAGATITGAASDAAGTVVSATVTSGTWVAGTAAGVLVYEPTTGSLESGEAIQVGTNPVARCASSPTDHLLGLETPDRAWRTLVTTPAAPGGGTPCNFFYPKPPGRQYPTEQAGERTASSPMVQLPPTVSLDGHEHRIRGTSPTEGWSGLYAVEAIQPIGRRPVRHWELTLREIQEAA